MTYILNSFRFAVVQWSAFVRLRFSCIFMCSCFSLCVLHLFTSMLRQCCYAYQFKLKVSFSVVRQALISIYVRQFLHPLRCFFYFSFRFWSLSFSLDLSKCFLIQHRFCVLSAFFLLHFHRSYFLFYFSCKCIFSSFSTLPKSMFVFIWNVHQALMCIFICVRACDRVCVRLWLPVICCMCLCVRLEDISSYIYSRKCRYVFVWDSSHKKLLLIVLTSLTPNVAYQTENMQLISSFVYFEREKFEIFLYFVSFHS